MKDMLNKANRDIAKLKQDLKQVNDDHEGTKIQMSELKNEKEEEAKVYESEIDRLRKHLEELEEEHEELRSKYQIKHEINNRVEEESKCVIL